METLAHSKNYFSASFANEGLKFLSIPVLTYLLSTSDYGILNIFGAWVSILAVLAVFNLNGAISRYYYEFSEDFGQFLGYSLLLASAAFGVTSFFILLFHEKVATWLELPDMVIFFLVPAILFQIIEISFRQVYQPIKDSKRIRKYSIGNVYITFALTVILILLRDDTKYIGRLQAMVFVSGIYAIFKIRDIIRYTKIGFNKKYFSYIAKFSLPNIPYLLSGTLLSQFDRIIINHHLGTSEAGLYCFAYNIGMLQLMVSNAIHNAWTPKYYEYMHAGKVPNIVKDASFYSRLMAFAACGLVMFGAELGTLLSSKSYHASLYLIPWVVIGHFFVGISPFNKNAIIHAKRTYITATLTLTAGVIKLLLNLWLIPIYGSIAAAYTTLFSYIFLFMTEYLIAKYLLKSVAVPLKTFALPSGVVLMSGLLFFFFFMNTEISFWSLLIKCILIGFFGLILFFKEYKSHLLTTK